jgi:hypothetical protein
MPQQYTATDNRTGLQVTLQGDFPPEPDDRIRIAATTNLFTRLMATVLATENATDRRGLFRSLEMALEWADAAARQDMEQMGSIVQRFLNEMGITPDQIEDMIKRLQEGQGPEGPFGPLDPTNPN